MTTRYLVALASEIPPGSCKVVEAGGRTVGVYNIGGSFFALRNVCPHQGAELCKGLQTAYVAGGQPGEFVYEREKEIVRCPWHQWEFDIKTGVMVVDKRMRTKCYEVTVEKYDVTLEDQQVFVHME